MGGFAGDAVGGGGGEETRGSAQGLQAEGLGFLGRQHLEGRQVGSVFDVLGEQRTFVGAFGVAGTLAGGRTLAGETLGTVFGENGLFAGGAVVGLRFLHRLFTFIGWGAGKTAF